MKHWRLTMAGLTGGLAMLCLWPAAANAGSTSLQVAPLQYEAKLESGKVSTGFIDVANPTGTTITIQSSVRGFKQTGTDGGLEFFDDPILAAAIKPGLTEFALGPREAVRVVFSVDATKLPQGGVYAAIFFNTAPPRESASHSYIAEIANIGTLLLLTNGEGSTHQGQVQGLMLKHWQWGSSLEGAFSFTNTDHTAQPVGFKPQLNVRVMPWGHRQDTETGFVLPGTTRQFSFTRPGAYFGLLTVTVADADTGTHTTSWVLACTGWCRWAVPVVIVALGYMVYHWRQRRRLPVANDQSATD